VLSLAAALGLAFFGVRASWIVVVGPFSAALGLTAALGFLLQVLDTHMGVDLLDQKFE
jgi:hypothetical protein